MSIIKSLHQVALEEYQYQQDLKNGKIQIADTGFRFINNSLLGGVNPTDVLLVAALSGVGKSTIGMRIAFNVATLNKDVRVLFFSFEVPGRKIAAKLISKDIRKSLFEMYQDLDTDKQLFDNFKGIPFDIIETPYSVPHIKKTIDDYRVKYPNMFLHIIFDHTLLIETLQNDTENDTLIKLSNYINKDKKVGLTAYYLISQLNNSMLDPKRMAYPGGQYPNQTDIFGSKYLFHVANNVYILMNPIGLNLPSKEYGIHRLPFTTKNKQYDYTYAHVIKARDGSTTLEPLKNDLKYSDHIQLTDDQLNAFKELYKY